MSKAGNYIVAAAYFVAGYYTGNPGYIQMGYLALASSAIAEDRQRKARNRARDAYNASLQDRMVMLDLRPDAPRTIALGRVRAVEGVRRRWASGANNEQLTLIVSFAGHEIDGFEKFWFNDIPLELDVDGYVTKPALITGCSVARTGTTATLTKTAHGRSNGEKVLIAGFSLPEFNGNFVVGGATANTFTYAIENTGGGNPPGADGTIEVLSPYVLEDNVTETLSGTLDGSGNASVTLTSEPIGGTVTAVYSTGTGESSNQGTLTITLDTGLDYDITGGPAGAEYVVNWQNRNGTPMVRIRPYTGTDAQDLASDLMSEYPGKLAATDAFAGIALAVIDLTYDDSAFPQGIPNITATFRGAKCLDPRTDLTVWTENPAVHAYHYARHANGWAVPVDEIRAQDFEDAADFCDASTDFTLGDTDVTLVRYRSGIVLSTDADPRQNMGAIMETMAGRWGWAGGTLRMRCGRMSTPVFAMDSSWIAQQVGSGGQASTQPVVRISNGVPREEKVNHVGGSCVDPDQRYQALPYPSVRDEVLIVADGAEYRLDADMPGVNHIAHAQHLASIIIREGQAPLRMEVMSNLSAYPLELFDVGEVTVERYGMADKTFEVTGWRWRPTDGVMLRLAEITDEIFEPVDSLQGLDPAPNGSLPSPWYVQQISGLEADSEAVIQSDGSVLTLTTLTWNEIVQQAVLSGGKVEIQYVLANAVPAAGVDWSNWIEQGSALSATIPGLQALEFYLFRARAINSLGVRGAWSLQVLYQILSDTTPPEDVTNLAWEIKPGQVVITCDPCIALDYAATELRFSLTLPAYDSGDWAAATFLVRGKSNEYHHPRPPNGTYYAMCKHIDNSGNYSDGTAYITVVVDDSIDFLGATGTLVLTTDRFPFFSFADGTTHTAQAPGDADIIFTATLIALTGAPTFTAVAYNASAVSLGSVTLTGSGLTRTLTAAAFVAPGTSGSVRSVVVTATLAGVSDEIIVYRQDSTTTAPRIYLSNPSATIATDSNGAGGDYSSATTLVEVYIGLTADTANWSFAITPDSGVTATINGGAGPVTGTGSVTVAVSAMTVPDGVVLITASKSGETDLTASFYISKNEATGLYNAYWNPRAEIILPVGADGAVSSYADAFSSLEIDGPGGISDVANWSLTKVDTNVTSTLTGNLVQITAMSALGSLGTDSNTDISAAMPTGWSDIKQILIGDGFYIACGSTASTTSKIQRSTDFATWTTIDIGASYTNHNIAYGNGVVIITEHAAVNNAYRYSLDDGLTWSAGTFPTSFQRYGGSLAWMGDRFVVCANGSTTAYWSSNGTSWTSFTAPASNGKIYGSTGRWLMETSSATYHYSTNSGTSWTTVTPFGGSSINLLGASYFKGRWVLVPNDSAYAAAGLVRYSDNAVAWNSARLPTAYLDGTALSAFLIIRGVLYLGTNLASGVTHRVMYTTDGLAWSQGGSLGGARSGVHENQSSIDHQIDILPTTILNSPERYYTYPLTATSDTDGFVTVTATKPGEADIVRVLPVRKGAITSAGFAFRAQPYGWVFPATSDGVVTNYSGATLTAYVERDGIDDTANWSFTYTTSNLTPSSGSSNSITITAMNSATDTGTVTFTATRAGYPSVSGTLVISKAKGSEDSGPRIGAAYSVIDAANTLIGVRFNTDGSVDVKRGSGGSYTRLTQWAGAVVAGIGSSCWLYVAPRAGTHALSTGTENAWLALSSARTFELSDATSGTHTYEADVFIGTSSAGANAVAGYFSMKLLVP